MVLNVASAKVKELWNRTIITLLDLTQWTRIYLLAVCLVEVHCCSSEVSGALPKKVNAIYMASFLGLCSSLCYSVSMHCLSLFSHSHSVYLGSSEVAQALSESPVVYRTVFLHLYLNACRILSGREIFCICTLQPALYFLSVRDIFKSAVADRLIPQKDFS